MALLTTVCEQVTCRGPIARLRLLRDPEGALQRVFYTGDLTACSHPPAYYFSTTGEHLRTIPERGLSPEEAYAIHQEYRDGLQFVEGIRDPCAATAFEE